MITFDSGSTISSWWRLDTPKPQRLDEEICSDLFGGMPVYYTVTDGCVYVSRSISTLAAFLGRVTVNALAILEMLLFKNTVHCDETLLHEVKVIPAGTTLSSDGSLSSQKRIVQTADLAGVEETVTCLSDAMAGLIGSLEKDFDIHLAGLSCGKDSRILAAHPKATPNRWHWINIGETNSGEARGGRHFAKELGVPNFVHLESPTGSEFCDPEFPVGVDAANAASYAFESMAFSLPITKACADHPEWGIGDPNLRVAFWCGTLADVLFGPTWLDTPGTTIWEAFGRPDVRFLPTVFQPDAIASFEARGQYYRSQPFPLECRNEKELMRFLLFLTYGRRHICGGADSIRSLTPYLVSPFLLSELTDISLRIDSDILRDDAVRIAWLERCKTGCSGPDFTGFGERHYFEYLRRRLASESRKCDLLDRILDRRFLSAVRSGKSPARLDCVPTKPLRKFAAGLSRPFRTLLPEKLVPSTVRRLQPSLTEKKSRAALESLLSAVTFLNGLFEKGVEVRCE